jgi:orotidine-5'-phosphate decarboxylase
VNISTEERLIVALDVPDIERAKALVLELGDTVRFYKIGLELAMTGGYFELLRWLLERRKRVFADLKFYDIPATVAAAVRQISGSGATFLTVHGERAITEAAAAEKGAELKILAVTVLTSIEPADLDAVGIRTDIETLARRRAALAIRSGCDGVIASGQEAGATVATRRPGRRRGTASTSRPRSASCRSWTSARSG